MERIDKTFVYKGYNIKVFKGLADSDDLNWDQEIKIKIEEIEEVSENKHYALLILKPLWCIDGNEDEDCEKTYKSNYGVGDYFQQTFNSCPPRKGLGSILHDFIINNKNEISLNNVYSTNKE